MESEHGDRPAWSAFVDLLPVAATAIDPAGRVVAWNLRAEQRWGGPASERLGRDLRDVLDPASAHVVDRLCGGEAVETVVTSRERGDRAQPVVGAPVPARGDRVVAAVLLGSGGDPSGDEQGRFRSLVQNAGDLLVVSDADGTIRYVSPAAERILGRSPAELVGTTPLDLVHLDDVDKLAAAFAEKAGLPGDGEPVEIRFRHADGTWRWLEATTTNLLEDVAVSGMVINARDVTERRALEQELAHLALHDALTGLANRVLLTDRIALALERLRRHPETLTVLMLDLDRFKLINDALGHAVGDQLLVAVAERLSGTVRPEDTVARLGGDEFVVVCQELTEDETAVRIAERIAAGFSEPFDVGPHRLHVTPSIGMTTATTPDAAPEQLLRDADVAMYRAKRAGRTHLEPYDAATRSRFAERVRAEAALQHAVDHDEFLVRYQPVIELDAGRISSFEALVRWRHPEEGILLPHDFLGLAEYTDLIVPIGRSVLHRACGVAAEVAQAFPASPPWVSVNVSARQLADPSLPDDVAEVLDVTGARADRLLLELSVGGLDLPAARGAVAQLKEQGVRVALDDFGSGDVALGSLRDLPVDVLKIDRTVVAALPGDRADSALVGAVIDVARALDITVVAKGVERADQLEHLRRLGCTAAQGFHLGEPVDRRDLDALMG